MAFPVHVCLVSEEGGLHDGRLWVTVWCPPFGTLACTRLFMTVREINKHCSVLGPSCSRVREVLSLTSGFGERSSYLLWVCAVGTAPEPLPASCQLLFPEADNGAVTLLPQDRLQGLVFQITNEHHPVQWTPDLRFLPMPQGAPPGPYSIISLTTHSFECAYTSLHSK